MPITTRKQKSDFANDKPIPEEDAAVLESIAGHEDRHGAGPGVLGSHDIEQPIGAQPRSEITGRHDEGAGANETVDGLSDTEEMTRSFAEDIPTGLSEGDDEDVPVFERGRTRTDL
ncbi:hypothetical protein EN925_24030 [Mesorhizobium sp. M7A.F.Ca.US.006.04.2.1]|nr:MULTISPECIES: hypothetical protein [unclassified Mesorhizobium]RUX72356.1 hypothetical protein EN990_25345 [Mesorhizobium sp. M7A.F.Ca.US.005.03.1.1]RUY25020.1 hypothetical protein EN979_24375 [Mesorhizobium sp. M7A.F.Ca.US.001.04.2.1]RUY38725.1 hypothetical protein EN978_23290 [Mesorhizobium sp. M7A.F.Ca.US.001.04.1.1]RVA86624.1 hypothetical protein EN925_24030 [Mesorhizobium sp. M7A.F.Ca.US.006.04.2.1]